MKKPNVLDFVDYREFLNSFAQYMKATTPQWSYGQWARELGLKSTSAITMILKKQRNMGPSMAKKFSKYFSFTQKHSIASKGNETVQNICSFFFQKMMNKIIEKHLGVFYLII